MTPEQITDLVGGVVNGLGPARTRREIIVAAGDRMEELRHEIQRAVARGDLAAARRCIKKTYRAMDLADQMLAEIATVN